MAVWFFMFWPIYLVLKVMFSVPVEIVLSMCTMHRAVRTIGLIAAWLGVPVSIATIIASFVFEQAGIGILAMAALALSALIAILFNRSITVLEVRETDLSIHVGKRFLESFPDMWQQQQQWYGASWPQS